MTKELICIACPRGCALNVTTDEAADTITVSGNSCPKGIEYGEQEIRFPMRTLTTTVACRFFSAETDKKNAGGQEFIRIPVKTGCEIPLKEMKPMISKIRGIVASSPIRYGDCLARLTVSNGSEIPIIACASTEDFLWKEE